MEGDRVARALGTAFYRAAACVRAHGFDAELKWAREASLDQLTEQTFLSELAWCVLNSGMRESVVRGKWPAITQAFLGFASSRAICAAAETCVILARRAFNHEQKIAAIVQGARKVEQAGGFDAFKARLIDDPLGQLRAFAYIGPVTVFHLARNLGVDCSKPDRHLVRYAARWGFDDVENFCRTIADVEQERIGAVDVVIWRHSVIGCACLADLEPQPRIDDVVNAIATPPGRATGRASKPLQLPSPPRASSPSASAPPSPPSSRSAAPPARPPARRTSARPHESRARARATGS